MRFESQELLRLNEKQELEAIISRQKSPRVYLQPIVDAGLNMVHGYEVLSRGPRDTIIADITPFIVAERYGLEKELDLVMLDKVFDVLPEFPEGNIFINCFLPNLDYLYNKLKNNPPGRKVIIEIDFSGLLVDIIKVLREIEKFKTIPNVSFAIDDIGKYNLDKKLYRIISPQYMKVDICITRGIAKNEQKQELLEDIAILTKDINAALIIEGVESKEDAEYLMNHKLNLMQGYYFQKPQDYQLFK